MSLRLHLASRSEELLDALCPGLARARAAALEDPSGIPRPVPVLVPSAQLGDWLRARLARDLGVSMGFDFVAPADYFARAFADDEEARDFAAAHAWWRPERLRWKILPRVDDYARELGHAEARGPLLARDRFAYAELLAAQLDRYVRHRPGWPAAWASGRSVFADGVVPAAREDEAWQARLWHELAESPDAPPHPALLLGEWASREVVAGRAAAAPPLFVVGAELLDPLLLATLRHLAARGREISLHLLLPSLGYLGDQSRRDALQTLLERTPRDDALELGGHPLLASLGQQAAGEFLLLEQIEPDYATWPDAAAVAEPLAAGAPLLARIQADIRAQRTPPGAPAAAGDAADARAEFSPDDRGIGVHACHSPRRELEVLRDELLRAFAEIPGLRPEDVLIAAPDFDAYAPLAQGIFRAATPPLPVRLTVVPEREANPVAAGLLALLTFASGRHGASELIELLNLAALQQHLGLVGDGDALAHLAEVVRSSGLTHDIDVHARPHGDATGTWRAALDRHLAGAWLGAEPAARDSAGEFAHPLAPELPRHDEARARFLAWLTRLAGQQLAWREEAPAAEWAARLATAVRTLLHAEENDDHAAAVLRFLGELRLAGAPTPLDAGALLDWLGPKLENATSLRTSLGGEILFGRLDQLHGLPCRVFALLGMQDGAFPRASRRPAWDLLAHRPERWDADARRRDRQHFLDALLAPGDRLILTASNRSLRTAHDGPLASCVEELLRAAAATARPVPGAPAADKALVRAHRIQPFAGEYFERGGPPRSFDANAARIARRLAAPSGATAPSPFAAPVVLAATSDAWTPERLVRFWRDPAEAWLRVLDIETPRDETDDETLDDAPLELDGLQTYAVDEVALRSRLAVSPAPDPAAARLVADRALPPGALGRLVWRRHERAVAPMAAALARWAARARPSAFALDLGGGATLAGEIRVGDPDAEDAAAWVLVYRPGKYEKRARHQLSAFVETVVAAVHLGRPAAARVCGTDEEPARILPAIAPEAARAALALLIEGASAGRAAPLCFAPETSARLAEVLRRNPGDPAAALEAAAATWFAEGGDFGPAGEGSSAAARLAWRDADPFAAPRDAEWLAWAGRVSAPVAEWWAGARAPGGGGA